jgi:hypothetical protein
MALLLLAFGAPLLAALALVVAYATARAAQLTKPSGAALIRAAATASGICIGLALSLTVIAMVIFEVTTNLGAGNGPLGFIFIYGPLAIAAGMLSALAGWWFGWPTAYWLRQMRPNKSLERTREG